jgi:hypothetical protein
MRGKDEVMIEKIRKWQFAYVFLLAFVAFNAGILLAQKDARYKQSMESISVAIAHASAAKASLTEKKYVAARLHLQNALAILDADHSSSLRPRDVVHELSSVYVGIFSFGFGLRSAKSESWVFPLQQSIIASLVYVSSLQGDAEARRGFLDRSVQDRGKSDQIRGELIEASAKTFIAEVLN